MLCFCFLEDQLQLCLLRFLAVLLSSFLQSIILFFSHILIIKFKLFWRLNLLKAFSNFIKTIFWITWNWKRNILLILKNRFFFRYFTEPLSLFYLSLQNVFKRSLGKVVTDKVSPSFLLNIFWGFLHCFNQRLSLQRVFRHCLQMFQHGIQVFINVFISRLPCWQ